MIAKISKIARIFLLVLLFTIGLLYILLRSKPVQSWLVQKVTGVLSEQLGTKVRVGAVDIDFFKTAILEDIYIEDQKKDTLFFIRRLKVDYQDYDENKHIIKLNYLGIEGAKVLFGEHKGDTVNNYDFFIDFFDAGPRDPKKPKLIWTITSQVVELERSRFDYFADNDPVPDFMDFDYNHMSFMNIEARLKNFSLVDDSLHFITEHLETTEKCGIRVDHLSADTKIHGGGIEFRKLSLLTPNSKLGDEFIMETKNWKDYNDFNNKVKLIANLRQSEVSTKDLSFFNHNIKDYQTVVKADGHGEGVLSRLKGKKTELKLFGNTLYKGDWSMTGLPDFENTILDFDVKEFETDYTDLEAISLGNIPENFKSLGKIRYKGMFSGFYNDFISFGSIRTDIGSFESDINVKYKQGLDLATYSGSLKTENFLISRFMPEAKIDALSFDLKLKGTGMSRNTYHVDMEGAIDKLSFLGYDYHNIEAKGTVSKESFSGSAKIRDVNLNMDFDGEFISSGAVPVAGFKAVVYHSNLATLGFDTTEQNIEGTFVLDFEGKNLDDAKGKIAGYDVRIRRNGSNVVIPELVLSATEFGNSKELRLSSDVADANIKGQFTLGKIDVSIMHMLHQLIPAFFNQPEKELPNEDFYFSFDLKQPFAITSLYQPNLMLEPCTGNGYYQSANQTISFNFFNELIEYGDLRFSNVNLQAAKHKDEKLKINVNVRSFSDKGSFYIDSANFNTLVYDNRIDFDFKGKDTGYDVGINAIGNVSFMKDTIMVYFSDVDLNIDGDEWKLDTNASCRITDNNYKLSHFLFANSVQHIELNGEIGQKSENSIDLLVRDFALKSLDFIMAKNKLPKFGGKADGVIQYKIDNQYDTYSSDLSITDFALGKDTLGDFSLQTWHLPDMEMDSLKVNVSRGLLDSLQIAGLIDYKSKKNNLNLHAHLPKTQLKVFEPFLEGFASRMQGTIVSKGDMEITGTFSKPVVEGKLHLEDASLRIDYLNVPVSFDADVEMFRNVVRFGPITVKDDKGHTGLAKGNITHDYFSDFEFYLKLSDMKQFHVLNTGRKENELYYGQAYVNGSAEFKGPFDNMDIKVNATTMAGTKFYLPISEGDASDLPSYVHFKTAKKKVVKTEEDFPIHSLIMDIEATPDAEVEIIFDETMGDKIIGSGSGNITMEMNKSADFYMFGTYKVNTGQYTFTFDLYQKKFLFKEGGTITFYGDPLDARLNLIAYNRNQASPDPLLESVAFTSASSGTSSSVNQKITVDSEIYLKGNLFSPEITFGLTFPYLQTEAGNSTGSLSPIINRIKADKDEVSRQVFSLLVLKRFLTPTFAQSTAGINNPGGAALSSAGSDLLSAQLSNWLSKIDPNWKVNFDIKNQTVTLPAQYIVSLNAKLNKRWTIDGSYSNYSTLPNVNVEYKVTKLGNVRIKAYSRSAFNLVNTASISTPITTNGVGIVYTKDFNVFRWFKKKKKSKKQEADESLKGAVE